MAVRQSVPIQIQVKLEANSWAMISGEQPRRSRSLTGTAYCVFESLSHTETHTLAAIATDGRGETVKIEAPVIAVEITRK